MVENINCHEQKTGETERSRFIPKETKKLPKGIILKLAEIKSKYFLKVNLKKLKLEKETWLFLKKYQSGKQTKCNVYKYKIWLLKFVKEFSMED